MSDEYSRLPLAIWRGPNNSLLQLTGDGTVLWRPSYPPASPWIFRGGPGITLEEAESYAKSYNYKREEQKW